MAARYILREFVEWFVILVLVGAAVDWAFSDPVVIAKIVIKSAAMAAAVSVSRWFVWGRSAK